MSEYTKGPWLLAGEDQTFVYALGPHGTNVFWAHVQAAGSERASNSEKVANARLIAAAPELLEVLESLWDVVDVAIQSGDWQVDGARDPEAELNRAARVIKKAQGVE